jgi:hypothetical protein
MAEEELARQVASSYGGSRRKGEQPAGFGLAAFPQVSNKGAKETDFLVDII